MKYYLKIVYLTKEVEDLIADEEGLLKYLDKAISDED
jgi:hypothetical protein